MNDVQCIIAPFINQRFVITSPWWTLRDGVIHKGLDIATPTSVGNAPVYSMVDNGKIVQQWHNHPSMGNALVIKSQTNNIATLYMHLNSFVKNLNDNVEKGELVGYEGTTGESTGIHLHVEMQNMGNSNSWNFSNNKSDYLNPTEYMGIPNILGTWCIYNGIIPPIFSSRKNKFKWVLYTNKIRERNS